MHKISIVVPVYNVEEYLSTCIESILCQNYQYLEIILVNDGSTDSSGKICERYQKIDERIKVLHKQNGGLSDARNKGTEIASGDYITYVDSDDFIAENYIEELYNILLKKEADIAVCSYIDYREGETCEEKSLLKNWTISLYSSADIIQLMYDFNRFKSSLTTAWGLLLPSKVAKKVTFPKGKLHEDEFTTYKYYLEVEKVAVTNQPLYFYRYRKDSIMNKEFNCKRLDAIEALEERLSIIEQKGIDIYKTVCAYLYLLLLYKYQLEKSNIVYQDDLTSKFKAYFKKYRNILSLKDRVRFFVIKLLGSYFFEIKRIVGRI
ncbi:glycosyltransferase involved in cell wall biosynthesis [Streptococcus gallinaceus]|uniref:glycosyltransferase family 2 protein n=1 Tax=Streptococcus gallinaceus TaxID=165758 RepID=UPI00209FDF88|nr:glycosyltransferase involved in cell wall biosynthesis [Streptococcus gallinaceus]MCP1770140.1 glycosyltransferase involved in cell wall biosynthesis [Streptococcus gallinaceus]